MKLVTLAAIIAVCGAAKLDRSYLPPPSAATAGGTSDSLQAPLTRSSEGLPSIDFPTGSYTNSFQGVVVDAAAPGSRASSDSNQSGLGGPRDTYGSTNSKVGDAAFRGSVAGFRTPPTFGGSNGQASGVNGQNFLETKPERPQASKDRNSNIISYANDVSLDNYSYGFETDNGIAVGENGITNNGIQAQGGYSYKGDDGQVYKVTYTADESGYRPQGSHLPTPPPIPKEILMSLEQNAKEEAAGLVDDGSYDAQKYNTEGDYTHNNGGNIQYNGVQLSQLKRPESDAAASSTFINQNSLTFGRPSAGQFGNVGTQNGHASFNTQSSQYGGSQINHNHLAGSQHKESSQALSGTNSHYGSTQSTFGSFSSQVASQNNQQGLAGHSETQNSNTQTTQSQFGNQGLQFGSQAGQFGSTSQFGVQPTKPSFGQSFSNPALAGNQGTQLEIQQGSYGQSVNHAQNSQSVGKPQYNQGHFGVTQNQLSNKPSSGIFTSNKPSTNNQVSSNAIASSGSSNNNRFPNVPNQFGSAYLPPFTTNDKPALNKPQTAEVATFEPNKNAQSINTVPHAGQFQTFPQASALPSASAFVSSSQSGFVSQPGAPVNSFQISTQPNQISNNNSLTMQGVINSNLSPSSSPNKESNTAATISPFVISQSKPTAIPDTELTTPLEPGEKPAFSPQSPFNTQFSSNYGNSDSQTINTVDQTQLGSQSNVVSQQSGQSGILPGGSSLISITSTPAAFPTVQQTGFSTQNPLFSHNQFSQTQQNNAYYSTQKPSFSQGPDDSYYYNQPSKPFITPAARPQGSRFPNTPSYQSNGIASSQNNQLTSQQGTFPSNTNLPSKPSYTSVAPISSQNTHTQGSFSNNFNNNGITEAAISPFPPASPTTSTQLGTTLIDQSRPSSNLLGKPTIIQQSSTFQTFTSKPNIGQKPSTFTQSQVQTGQTSSNNQPINSQTLTQQYQGTIYQYNKPAQTLPAPAQTDSSSSQSIQTDSSSKPQLGSQQTQFNQNSFGSQSQQTSFNQGSNTKPQFGIQNNKPFGSSLSNTQFAQNTQGTFSQTSFQQNSQASHNNVHPIKPNGSQFIQAIQTGTSGQQSFGSQFNSQAVKPIGSSSSSTTFGQNTQQAQGGINAGHFTSSQQTHEAQNSVHGQNTQNSFGSQNSQQTGVQFGKPSNKPFGSVPRPQFGQVSQSQGSYSSGFSSSQQNVQGSQFTSQPFKPFGISGFAQSTGTKPQIGTQTSQALFTQNSQQSFGTQASSQPAQTGVFPTRPSAASSTVHGSPDSLKPHFGQNTGTQGNKPLSAFEQFFQSSQYGSSASKPQIGVQTQFGQNAPTPAQGTGISTSQYGQASVQTPVQTSQTPQSYKPFGSSSGSSVHHQATQTSQTGATASGSASFGTQTYKPFGASQGPTNKPQGGSFLTPCCKNSQGSPTKPNQAFGQAQNQFAGFQGTQSFSAQSVAGKGEEFGGPREPPRFDAQTGYHY